MSQNPLAAFVAQNPSGVLVALKVDAKGGLLTGSEAAGATAIIASSGTVAAATAAASLAAATGKTTYITGFTCTGAGATAASSVSVTISGIAGGTPDYIFTAPVGATVGATPLNVQFTPPIPASALNTAIVVTMPSLGAGNLAAAVTAYGFQL